MLTLKPKAILYKYKHSAEIERFAECRTVKIKTSSVGACLFFFFLQKYRTNACESAKVVFNRLMTRVFIDESGNLGRGGRFFVLAAIVFLTRQSAKKASRYVRKMQKRLGAKGSPLAELKSCRMSFVERQMLLNGLMASGDIEFYYLVVEKARVSLLRNGYPQNLIYNYFTKLLVDDIFTAHGNKTQITLDERTTKIKSANSLRDYLLIDAYANFNKKRDEIEILQADSRMVNNLQLADLIAGTVYQAYTRHQRHFLDLMRCKIRSANEFPEKDFSQKMFREADGRLLKSYYNMPPLNEDQAFDSAPALA